MNRHPQAWVATLFFTQGLPFSIVTVVSTLFYKNLGIDNHTIIIIGSFFYIPWVIKPIASPIIESLSGKYQWTVATQLTLSFFLLCLAIAVTAASPLWVSALIFFIIATVSAMHDTASDGVYLLNLDLKQQYKYVGIRNCFYLMARLFCQSGLVYLAYFFEKNHSKHGAWGLCYLMGALLMLGLCIFHIFSIDKFPSFDRGKSGIIERVKKTSLSIVSEWQGTYSIFFLVSFFIIYNCTEAQLIRVVPIFFMDTATHGGLNLKLSSVAVAQFIGVISLLVGGFFAAFFLKKNNLNKMIYIAVIGLLISNSGYFFLSLLMTGSHYMVFFAYSLAQFSFGFGNGVFMALLMKQAGDKEHSAAYYALATALTSLGYILFGILGGAMLSILNYKNFFIWIFLCGLVIVMFTINLSRRCVFS